MIALVVSWCRTDAQQHGYRIRKITLLLLIFVQVIGLPVYFLRTRGLVGLRAILKAACLGFVMMMAGALGMLVMMG